MIQTPLETIDLLRTQVNEMDQVLSLDLPNSLRNHFQPLRDIFDHAATIIEDQEDQLQILEMRCNEAERLVSLAENAQNERLQRQADGEWDDVPPALAPTWGALEAF